MLCVIFNPKMILPEAIARPRGIANQANAGTGLLSGLFFPESTIPPSAFTCLARRLAKGGYSPMLADLSLVEDNAVHHHVVARAHIVDMNRARRLFMRGF